MKKIYIISTICFSVFLQTSAAEPQIQTTETISASSTATTTASTTPSVNQIFTECSQNAIEKRDTSIAVARTTYNTAMADALVKRKNLEKSIVAMPEGEKKKEALKAAVDAYRKSTQGIQDSLTQARKVSWDTFDATMKLCRDAKNDALSAHTKQSGQDGKDASEIQIIKESVKAQIDAFKSLFKKQSVIETIEGDKES